MSITYSEIKSQYDACERAFSHVLEFIPRVKEFIAQNPFKKVIFIGCGSSFMIAQSLCQIARIHTKMPADAYAAGDLLLHLDRYKPYLENSLIFAISRSGSTSEVLLLIESLKAKTNVKVAAMTAMKESKLSDMADISINMPWAFDESVCQTRTVTCFYTIGAALLALLSDNTNLFSELKKVIGMGDAYLNRYEDTFKRVAQLKWTDAVVLADAELEGIASEGALAFKEICQLPSNYYHILDCRHGPMVMIRSNTLVIVAMSDGNQPHEKALINDLLKKQCHVIVFSDTKPSEELGTAFHITFGENISHASRGIPLIAICQMISYFKALEIGVNPDSPDGLEPWIKL